MLSCQLILNTLCVITTKLAVNSQMQKLWYVAIVTVVVAIVIEILMIFTKKVRESPTNYVLLGVFSICKAFTFSFIASYLSITTALFVWISFTCLTIGLTAYSYYTKIELSWCSIFFGLLIAILASMITHFIMSFAFFLFVSWW